MSESFHLNNRETPIENDRTEFKANRENIVIYDAALQNQHQLQAVRVL